MIKYFFLVIASIVFLYPGTSNAQPKSKKSNIIEKLKSPKKAAIAKTPSASAPVAPKAEEKGKKDLFSIEKQNVSNEPTYINSDNLTLKAKERIFYYSGNVTVTQGDMNLMCNRLEGRYAENNQIDNLTAIGSVTITKGPNIKASGERAFYDAVKRTIRLTENPQVEQDGSILNADAITVFLDEERSTAEGKVRVKLISPSKEEAPKSLIPNQSAATPVPAGLNDKKFQATESDDDQ